MIQARRHGFSLRRNSKQTWHYVMVEPFIWLFYCFFQPMRFKSEFGVNKLRRRIVLMIRLALPIFLISYPLAFVVQFALMSNYLTKGTSGQQLDVLGFLLSIAWITMISVGCGTVGGILGGIAGDISLGIVLGVAFSIGGVAGNSGLGFFVGMSTAIALGAVGGMVYGGTWGWKAGLVVGLVGGIAWAFAAALWLNTGSTQGVIVYGIIIAFIFFISYIFGYYRLPLYPVSGISGLKAFFASKKDPLKVFFHMHHSSLYWDERVFLPLPRLKDTLLIAAGQDTKLTLDEIAFIVAKRPQQIGAAQAAVLEIALHDLEMCQTIRDISRVSQWLSERLQQEVSFLNPSWVTPFARLNDASRDAARYCGPLSWKVRHEALEDMINNLEKVYPRSAFADPRLNKRLSEVVNTWKEIYRYELKKLEQSPEKTGQIDNPYNPGQVLKPRDSLFVGRRDLVQQLAESLSKGDRRPTFLLNGERRMGKSSTLKQLPNLLGAYYLPIVFDMQVRGASSGTDELLTVISGEIYKAVSARGMRIQKLEHSDLREASRRNEAEVYRLFDEWLDKLEKTLETEDRTLLLLFDEFEKLEESGQAGYLNLDLLLDWFRSTIQNRPRVALLFSGVRTFGEMGANWAAYFVNAQTLKVSFLQPSEAIHLITQPRPYFPSEEIFGEGVIEQIIHVTGCHPFLIQAVCSRLIDNLNADNHERAEVEDVAVAVNQVLESWWDTYFRDLWERSDKNQQTCLVALKNGSESDSQLIAQQSRLDEQAVRSAMYTLRKRDLVLYEMNKYRIATPIYCEWVNRNC